MKKLALLVAVAAALVTGVPARAQVFGQYTPADILPVNSRMGGAYVDFSENTAGLLGQLRLSFYPNVDFGFQGGFLRYEAGGGNDKSAVRLGADIRFGVQKADGSMPFDVAVGGALGVISGDNYHILRLGPSVVASRAFGTSSGSTSIAPFAGAMLSFANVDVRGNSESDFSVPLRLGAELRAMAGLRITGELDLRLNDDFEDHTGFSLGVNLPF